MSNTPNFEDEKYIEHKQQLKVVNDFYSGIDTAKQYINKFGEEDSTTYSNRLSEAFLSNQVFTTVDTIKNIIFRKSIDTSNIKNEQLAKWIKKINLKDNINEFAKNVLKARVRDGYTFILVDAPSYDNTQIVSKSDLERNKIRPYLVNILRSQVINWEVDDNQEYTKLTISETYVEKVGIYGKTNKPQLRMFELIDGKCEVSIWRENKEISRTRLSIDMIPIIKFGNNDIPPLYDQAKINIAHLNRTSEKSNYVRVGSAPFPLIWGDEETSEQKTLSINSGIRFNGTKNETGFEWAELKGNNYDIIQKEIEYLEKLMEKLTVEFATEVKNKTATQVEKDSTSNEARLTDYATELESSLNQAIEMMGLYYDSDLTDNFIVVNKDFDSNILTSDQIAQLIQLRVTGNLSWNELRLALEKGEVLRILDDKERQAEELRISDGV